MKRLNQYFVGMVMSGFVVANAWAGEASTSASVRNGWGPVGGAASATAHYTGDGPAGLARTRTRTGDLNTAHGLAVGVDKDGLDFSYSHAMAGRVGPAYAGTFNLSIGTDGDVSGSYGGVVARGGAVRSVEAGGVTRTTPHGATAVATARGDASPNGSVEARTHSYNHAPRMYRPAQRVVRQAPRGYGWR